MVIVAIDTSCDETSVAVTKGRRVLATSIYSQVLIHKKWGGVVPSLAKRAHEERIDLVFEDAMTKYKRAIKSDKKFPVDYIAVTQGPGLAVALEVGIKKAKELSRMYGRKIIAVNHLEGHIYSPFVQNREGNPTRDFTFPCMALVISGGHTQIIGMPGHVTYNIIGETIDDAAGEALDKAAKMLGLGYPGGPIIERLAHEVGNVDPYRFPRPMVKNPDLNLSFSGLKTSLYYFLRNLAEEEKTRRIREIVSSFQEAVFDSILIKTEKAMRQTGIRHIIAGGGVTANMRLRKKLRKLAKKNSATVLFPPYPYLTGDNAAMIGVAAYYKVKKNIFVKNTDSLDRIPRFSL
ncbi:MAG: tRNA (adenosine(37)-N6)-threonylcarbamoyltransferase complex transferase subunit TsaD [Patescibacteria group bacterium]